MRRDDATARSLLRWYPHSWRARYGDELVALVAEEAGDRRLPIRVWLDLVASGLRERVRASGLAGGAREPREDVRVGALCVLSAWSLLVLGGIGFQNLSENFQPAVSGHARTISIGAFSTVVVAAALGALLLALGALAAIGPFLRFVRAGHFRDVKRRFGWAAMSTVAEVAALAAIVPWAHSLTYSQRNGELLSYSLAVCGFAALTAAMLALWTTAVVATARRMELPPRVLALEGSLALVVFAVMVVITAATAIWWVSVGAAAPWFLQGTTPGSHPSAFTPNLVLSLGCMAAATAIAGSGARRIARRREVLSAR